MQDTCSNSSAWWGAKVWTGCWVVQVRPFQVSISGCAALIAAGKVDPAAKQWFREGHETPMKNDGSMRSVETCHLPPPQTSANAWKNWWRVLSTDSPIATHDVAAGQEIP